VENHGRRLRATGLVTPPGGADGRGRREAAPPEEDPAEPAHHHGAARRRAPQCDHGGAVAEAGGAAAADPRGVHVIGQPDGHGGRRHERAAQPVRRYDLHAAAPALAGHLRPGPQPSEAERHRAGAARREHGRRHRRGHGEGCDGGQGAGPTAVQRRRRRHRAPGGPRHPASARPRAHHECRIRAVVYRSGAAAGLDEDREFLDEEAVLGRRHAAAARGAARVPERDLRQHRHGWLGEARCHLGDAEREGPAQPLLGRPHAAFPIGRRLDGLQRQVRASPTPTPRSSDTCTAWRGTSR
jgi:hypothetical protein